MHERVEPADIDAARRRFSDGRLKDLADEYSENYPHLEVVLARFRGLGWRFTLSGIDAFIRQLITDEEVKVLCSKWVFQFTSPADFAHLLYQLGFFGIVRGEESSFRTVGPQSTTPPAILPSAEFEVHLAYRDALDMRDFIVGSSTTIEFARDNILSEIPGGIDLRTYSTKLMELEDALKSLPTGRDHASNFEDAVGEVIRLCFYRDLSNVEQRARTQDGIMIRDWVASNRGGGGFWEMIRNKYEADQVVWECKNMVELEAEHFQQCSYYANSVLGRFVVMCFRGEMKSAYCPHVRYALQQHRSLLFPLGERDLLTFIRQARTGKAKDSHIQDKYDALIRRI